MPAPTWQANSSQQTNIGAITVAWPAGHSVSDLGLFPCQTSNEAITEGDTDFVLLGAQGAGTPGAAGATMLSLFWARAQSTSMPSVVTSDSGDHQTGVIQTYRGAYVGRDPILVGFSTGTGTTVTFPAGTTDADNALVLMILAHSNDAAGALVSGQANASLTDISENFDNGAITGTGGGICVTSGIKATAGAFVAGTATLSTSATWVAATVVIHSLAAPAAVDSTAPTIDNYFPVDRALTTTTAFSFDVTDDTALRDVAIIATFATRKPEIVYFDGFRDRYIGGPNARVEVIAGRKYRYTVLRDGGWEEAPRFELLVRDNAGNLGVAA